MFSEEITIIAIVKVYIIVVKFQDTFAELSSNLREEENFNHLKHTDKIKDVKNTKRADMISKLMMMTRKKNVHAMISVDGVLYQNEHLFRLEGQI